MGLFNRKKTLPELPKPEMQSNDSIRLPDFPSNDFPSYEALSSDLGSIKKAVRSPMPQQSMGMMHEEPQRPTGNEKTLFIKIDDYETAMAAIERLKEKLKDVDSVLNTLEKLKRQEDAELESWHKDVEALKQRLMTVESRLFHI
ncbi:MAG TPA: hypothetical protein VJJ21_02170 [Candidatus Nanoarchaeia archaeon]|nr:hypothetical protein [Candidatus Nanoarchaeia archaeon]